MGRLKRFENRAQLVRHISDETGTPEGKLWDELERQLDE